MRDTLELIIASVLLLVVLLWEYAGLLQYQTIWWLVAVIFTLIIGLLAIIWLSEYQHERMWKEISNQCK